MMNYKKIGLFLLILIMGICIVSATEINSTDIVDMEQDDSSNPNTITNDYNQLESDDNTKNIKSDTNSQTIILNSSNFDDYVTNRTFNEKVNPGDTIDMQGLFDGGYFSLNIDKPVNIISSTHDAYINVDSRSRYYGDSANDFSFKISYGGSGANISDITFHNTYIPVSNAHNISINNITATCNQAVGMGTGMISIRDESTNVNVTNSYFETRNNGGHSNVVFAYAHDCLFENNTVMGHGNVGNLVYITSYGSSTDTGETNQTYCNSNITIRNNYIDGTNATDNGICVGVVIEGANHTIVNNTILKTSYFMVQVNNYGTNTANITFEDNYCPLGQIDILNITDTDYETYGTLNDDVLELNENITNKHLNIKTTIIKEIYTEYPVDIIAINNTVTKLTLNYENIQVNELYAPETTLVLKRDANITNSTLKAIITDNPKTIISNNIIVNNEELQENNLASILLRQSSNQTIIKNNYLLAYNEENILCGDDAITKISGSDEVVENNTPNYSDMHILNTTTYPSLFDEDGILREEINGTIIITESISQPVIINKAINLTSQKIPDEDKQLRGALWGKFTTDSPYCFVYPKVYRIINYCNNIIFTNGSEQSNLTNTYAEQIVVNNTSINIKNNVISGNIQIFNSTNNIIAGNNVTTEDEHTIILDDVSTNNIIQNNTLIPFSNVLWIKVGSFFERNASINTFGDLSVYATRENIISNNSPFNYVNITIDCNDSIPFISTPIKINVTCNGELVNDGYVVVNIVNGSQVLRENLTNGCLEFNFTPSTGENLTFKVSYFPVNKYYSAVLVKNITIEKLDVTVLLESDDCSIGQTSSINAIVMDEYNNPIDNEVLTFIVNKTEYNTTINDGIATFTAKTNDTWVNGVYAKFYEVDKYNQATSNVIKPTKGEVVFSNRQVVDGDNLTVTVYLSDVGGSPVTSGYIRFKYVNGSSIQNKKIVDGLAEVSMTLSEVSEGMVIVANFTNNNAFNLRAENITLSLNPKTATIINVEAVNANVNQEVLITANVVDVDGNPVGDGSVTFVTDGFSETVDVFDGQASVVHTFTSVLNAMLNVSYVPVSSGSYANSSATTTIVISAGAGDVVILLEDFVGIRNVECNITANVVDVDGNFVSDGCVTFVIGDYNETVDVIGGQANLIHTFTKVFDGEYSVIYIPADDSYNSNVNVSSIRIEDAVVRISIDECALVAGSSVTFKAVLKDQQDNVVNGGKLVFKVNGKTLKDVNNKIIYVKVEGGIATITYDVADDFAGRTLNVSVVYSGTSIYSSARNNTLMSVEACVAPTLSIKLVNETTQTENEIGIETSISQDNVPIDTGKVIFKVNGKTLKDANGKIIQVKVVDGLAKVNYNLENLKSGTYVVTAIFIANGYDRITNETSLTIM